MNESTTSLRKPSTRREVLLLLKKHGYMSIQELSEQLGLTGNAILRHIHALQKERYIETVLRRQNAGRPMYIYRLTVHAEWLFPNQYDVLAEELIDELHHLYGESFVEKLFEGRMKKLEQKYQAAIDGQSFERRVAALAQIQDAEGYMVRLDKNNDGTYVLEQANCPVSKVATRYRQACQCEITLFQSLLDAHVERTESIADGETKCRYLFTERSINLDTGRAELAR